ncbi:hypothetical protein U8335_17240 [Roseiconus lacunae]|uniref:tetratricopeptide repeat protein n=1 Tax=Roseiconus lacunae TaxID=2605694 RepID=UPI003086022D|nr:hypothetical protein U8335_17240 [Stieleria sp. HD01]
MGVQHYLSCLWPGLSELWWRGRLSALPAAIAFGVGLNSYLVLRFLFPTWLDPVLVRSGFWVGFVMWGYWSIKSLRELPVLIAPRDVAETPDTFPEAQTAYLRRDWEQAETLLLEALRVEPRDPPALLLLSSVYRELGRPQHSLALLAEISRLEVGDHWHIELEAERGRAERLAEEQSEQNIDERELPEENFSEGNVSQVDDGSELDAKETRSRQTDTSTGDAAEMTAA